MALAHDWNQHYAAGDLPWDSGEPDPNLVELVQSGRVTKGRALEIGCGTGTNALWLAAQGFEVVAVDLAPLAVERARAKAAAAPKAAAERCSFEVRDFLSGELPQGSFHLVFDRGCFHVFDEAKDQLTFAARVGKVLESGGHWLSLLGSTEGPAREMGPPRRTARDILQAIEPAVELVQLRAMEFDGPPGAPPPKAWFCLSRRREVPAQPSSRFS
ncbi:MAG TPA: class I SAM-dependent methyltransferase [Polyangiales bacterium]|nr:class I SAM-dependent methyltransferase [Polyangiales bacterium]